MRARRWAPRHAAALPSSHAPGPPAPSPACPQVLQWAVAAVKQTKAAHYRGCSPEDLLDLLASDERRLYILLHNIDGPGAAV